VIIGWAGQTLGTKFLHYPSSICPLALIHASLSLEWALVGLQASGLEESTMRTEVAHHYILNTVAQHYTLVPPLGSCIGLAHDAASALATWRGTDTDTNILLQTHNGIILTATVQVHLRRLVVPSKVSKDIYMETTGAAFLQVGCSSWHNNVEEAKACKHYYNLLKINPHLHSSIHNQQKIMWTMCGSSPKWPIMCRVGR